MKKLLVLGSHGYNDAETKELESLKQFIEQGFEADMAGVKVYGLLLDEVGYVIADNKSQVLDLHNNCDLASYDLVYFRGNLHKSSDTVITAASYLKQHDVTHLNSMHSTRRSIWKISQAVKFAELGLPAPTTVGATAAFLPELIEKHLQYPVIVKDVRGSHGSNNYLVKSANELRTILREHPDILFMAQQFVPNDGDYRILVVGDEVAVIHRKGQEGSHLNNTSQDGVAHLVAVADLNSAIIEQSKQLAKALGYQIAGVDAIIDKNTGEHYFLEINSQPQLLTGAFTDLKQHMVAKYFTKLLQ